LLQTRLLIFSLVYVDDIVIIGTFILIYVNDIIIIDTDKLVIASLKSFFSQCFHLKDLSKMRNFLVIEVFKSKQGIYLSQHKYVLDILADPSYLSSRHAFFPIELEE
jgi:hypothetical protein